MGHLYHGELLVITRRYLKSPPSEFEGPKKKTATSFSTNISHTRGRYSRHLLALWSRHSQILFAGIADLFAGDWTKPNTIPDAPCMAYLPTFG